MLRKYSPLWKLLGPHFCFYSTMEAGNSFNTVKSKTSEGKKYNEFLSLPLGGGGEVASNAS